MRCPDVAPALRSVVASPIHRGVPEEGSRGSAPSSARAGVDLDHDEGFIDEIREVTRGTLRPEVLSSIGGFAGLFSLNVEHTDSPVLVSSTDGVGTKLKIAFMMGKHDTVGIDLVAMCVNDIMVQGAAPLFFLEYLSMGIGQ